MRPQILYIAKIGNTTALSAKCNLYNRVKYAGAPLLSALVLFKNEKEKKRNLGARIHFPAINLGLHVAAFAATNPLSKTTYTLFSSPPNPIKKRKISRRKGFTRLFCGFRR